MTDRDPLFDEMAQQMTPDADLRRRLDERLVAEPSQPAHSSQPARSQPAQPSRQPARVTMMPRSRWSRPATWVAAAAAVVLGVTVTSTLMLRGGTPRDAPATLAAPVAPVPADYSELYRAVAAAINTSDDGPPRQPGPQPQVSGPDREASLPQLDGNPPANDYTGDADEAAREPSDHTTTNTQVDGIDEADLVKTDGTTLYVVTGHDVALVKLAGPATRTLAHINITNPCPGCTVVDLLVHDGTLVVITEDEAYVDPSRGINPYYLSPDTRVLTYDVSDPISPRLRTTTRQSGQYRTARLSQAMVYVVSDYTVWPGWLNPDDPTTFVPSLGTPGEPLAPTDITVLPGPAGARYAVATATDVATGQRTAQQAVLGGADTVYMSAANLYMGGTSAPGRMLCCARAPVDEVRRDTTGPTTALVRMSLRGKALTVEAYGHVPGQLLNQFSLDEHDNRLRVVTTATNDTWQDVAQLYVLGPDLRRVGMTTLATNEQVKSVRFAGTVGYVVTFRQTDPLFAVDLSDPAHPQVMSELKIPGFSAYLHPWGEGHLVGLGLAGTDRGLTDGFKLSLFDITDPYAVAETAGLAVPGNYCEALNNHRAVMVDPTQDRLGFAVARSDGVHYMVYHVDAGGFAVEHDLLVSTDTNLGPVRAVRAGQHLYIMWSTYSSTILGVYELSTGSAVAQVTLS